MNTVQSLLKHPFRKRSQHEKIDTLKLGRPTPMLSIEKPCMARSRAYNRSFKPEVYRTSEWLCGCEVVNALFCFPCILFGGENTWTRSGMSDLNHLAARIKRHQNSGNHLNNEATMCVLRSGDVMGRMQEGGELARHNDKVKQNRYIVSKLVDCLRFCGAFELALDVPRGRGVFRGLLDFTAELDGAMRDHLEKATVFKGTSQIVRNDLLDCLLTVCRDLIVKEIENTAFLAVICEDTTDATGLFEKALVFRYELKGKVVERFWGFLNPTGDNGGSLVAAVLNALAPILEDSAEKLVSQSYDGAKLLATTADAVKVAYPNAHHVHCYAHDLHTVVRQVTSTSQPIRTFFHNLATIQDFFAEPKHVAILDAIVGARLLPGNAAKTVARHWNFHSHTVNTVHANLESLYECVTSIETSSLHEKTTNQASALRRQLTDSDFLFWLEVFHHVMPHVDILENTLRVATLAGVVDKAVVNFATAVTHVRDDMDAIVNDAASSSSHLVDERRKRMRGEEDSRATRTAAAVDVCDVIADHVRDRFEFRGHVHACNLLFTDRFVVYTTSFPQEEMNAAVEAYPFLDRARLKTELCVVYARQDFQVLKKGLARLFIYMHLNNMGAVFVEVSRLVRALLTTPMVCPENERPLATSYRLRTLLRHTVATTDRLEALAMLALERELIAETKDFNDLVIDKFAAMKSRRIDLVFQ